MKKFAGFNPKQQYQLLSKMGYKGPAQEDEMTKFMMARPEAAIKMGQYAVKAQEKLSQGKQAFANGGVPNETFESLTPTTTSQEQETQQQEEEKKELEQTATPEEIGEMTQSYGGNFDYRERFKEEHGYWPQNAPAGEYEAWLQKEVPAQNVQLEAGADLTPQNVTQTAALDPRQLVQDTQVAQAEAAQMDEDTGQITTPTPQAETATVGEAATAGEVEVGDTATAEAPEAVEPAQVETAVASPEIAEELTDMEAATADPSAQATVQGQMENLMADFEEGTPPWASGPMREATATMQARGLGASSMAGQAITQAAMEAAIPIAMQDAQTYASFEMQNLNNEQQTEIFKTQTMINGILSDQAATNASRQFNAQSENQTNQFMASLNAQVSQFNAAQINGMHQFSASLSADLKKFDAAQQNEVMMFDTAQKNAISQFNTQLREQREQFNAQNAVVVAQANAQWRQQTNLANTQAQNEANMLEAQTMNALTASAVDQIWQRERDLMAMAYESSENALERETTILLQQMDQDFLDEQGQGELFATLVDGTASAIGSIFD